jgi:hypothetical protein
MKKTIIVFIVTLILGIHIAHADVWVKTGRGRRGHERTILTEQEWRDAVGNAELREFYANGLHYENVYLNGKMYIHFFDIDEAEYWKLIKSGK